MWFRSVLTLCLGSLCTIACGGSAPVEPSSNSSATGGAGGTGSLPPGTVNPGGGSPSTGSGGQAGSAGASQGGSGTTPATPVDCSGIEDAGFELCSSGPTFCAAVFTDGAGCQAVCAAAGLTCAEVHENVQDQCAADDSLPALSCASTGHESDYCVCTGSGGPPSGGTGSGGTSSSGSGGSGSAGSGNSGSGATTCSSISDYGTVSDTIVVGSGEVFDGMCQRYRADANELGDGSQSEGQSPVFVLEDGATLKNVVLGAPAADGIHTKGDVTLLNVHWEDIGEDALTVEQSGTVVIDGGSAYQGADKVFQINAESTFRVSNFKASNAGKFIRQNGGTTFTTHVFIDACDISNMAESIFRTDSSGSTVSMTNTRYSDIGDSLFIGVSSSNVTTSNNTEY